MSNVHELAISGLELISASPIPAAAADLFHNWTTAYALSNAFDWLNEAPALLEKSVKFVASHDMRFSALTVENIKTFKEQQAR